MIKDIFFSFRDSMREKTSNPFLATYFIVLAIRNWDLIFTLFNFNPDSTLGEKISIVKGYYFSKNIIDELLVNILWTFGALIITYLLLNASRVIVTLSEKRLKPWIYSKIYTSAIVMKDTYEIVRNQRDELQIRLNQEREAKSILESEIKNLEESNRENLRIQAEKVNEDIPRKEPNKPEPKPKTPAVISDIDILYKKLESQNLLNAFMKISTQVRKGNSILKTSNELDSFLQLGLLRYSSSDPYNSKMAKFSLTQNGDSVLNKIGKM